MAEARYGRLFTASDVSKLIRAALSNRHHHVEDPDDLLTRALEDVPDTLTFPADEPMFLLRGKDKAAPDTISMYWEICMGFGDPIEEGECSDAHCDAVRDAGEALDAWQKANPERVKVPD